MILAVLLIILVAVFTGIAAFSEGGDAPRWAAISTIWLVIPVMIFGLIFLAILAELIYLLAQALIKLPPYSSKAQYYAGRAASQIKRFSDMAAKPVMFLEGILASIKAIFGRN